MNQQHIAILTTGRQDWGILRGIVNAMLDASDGFLVSIITGGMACDSRFGNLTERLVNEGLPVAAQVVWEINLTDDAPKYHEAAEATRRIGDALAELRPDALLLLGDRFETLAAAGAAVLLKIPIIHLHGGEETEGALDNLFRHAISKLSRLHFVSHKEAARRLISMGENPDCVFTVGAPGIDNLYREDLPAPEAVLGEIGMSLDTGLPLALITYHPPTGEGDIRAEVDAMLGAISANPIRCILTQPNDEPGNLYIREAFAKFAKKDPSHRTVVSALGENRYWAMLKHVDLLIGNSSSGLVEAPAVPVPVINLGKRQKGRPLAPCVISLEKPDKASVVAAIDRALNPDYRSQLDADDAPFGSGRSGSRIVEILRKINLDEIPAKKFYERT